MPGAVGVGFGEKEGKRKRMSAIVRATPVPTPIPISIPVLIPIHSPELLLLPPRLPSSHSTSYRTAVPTLDMIAIATAQVEPSVTAIPARWGHAVSCSSKILTPHGAFL